MLLVIVLSLPNEYRLRIVSLSWNTKDQLLICKICQRKIQKIATLLFSYVRNNQL